MMDIVHLILGLGGFLVLLSALGVAADSWERRDAHRRNHARRWQR